MKNSIKLIICIFVFIIVIFITNSTNAAIEVKSATGMKNISTSNAFATCYNLRASSSTLGNNALDPHLILNKEYGAVTYLLSSQYGGGGSAVTNIQNPIGNPSGRIYFTSWCQTASIIAGANRTEYTKLLYDNRNTKYVENFTSFTEQTTRGMGLLEVNNWAVASDQKTNISGTDYPIMLRASYWRYVCGEILAPYGSYPTQGRENSYASFRPVIWN